MGARKTKLTPAEAKAFKRGKGTITTATAAQLLGTTEDEITACLRIAEPSKVFQVEGWGQVGLANLYAFVPFPGFKSCHHLEVNERTEGKFQKAGSDHKPERITRIR